MTLIPPLGLDEAKRAVEAVLMAYLRTQAAPLGSAIGPAPIRAA